MEVKEIIPTGMFNKVQLELLKMFAANISEEDWEAIRDLAKNYFAAKLTEEMDKLFEEKAGVKKKLKNGQKLIFVHLTSINENSNKYKMFVDFT